MEIPKALLSSDAIIICLTPNSVDKEGYVQKEIKFALDKAMEMPEGRIFIIPARLEECDLPFGLKKYHAVELYEKGGLHKVDAVAQVARFAIGTRHRAVAQSGRDNSRCREDRRRKKPPNRKKKNSNPRRQVSAGKGWRWRRCKR
ncbi:MAG: toll/interleukin-1 receptor domain-containing protein [Anaerolineales bacterium]